MDGINLFQKFVELHKPQLESSGVPQHLWESLYYKLTTETFDAGEVFQLMLIEYEDQARVTAAEIETRPVFSLCVVNENGIEAKDTTAIYLIDHAWTFRMNVSRQQLQQHDQLTERLCAITGVDLEDEQRIDKALKRMWKYCQSYSIATEGLSDEERMPIWYIMDEVGSAVNHADDPNFRLVPFLHLDTQTTYSLLFPICDVSEGEPVTRDFLEYVPKNAPERAALLLPWRYTDLRSESFVQTEPDAEYFTSGHIPETYPTDDTELPQINRNDSLKVYAEYDVLREHLTSPDFELVECEAAADVLWLTRHYKDFAELSTETPNKFINQFPFEYVITIKDLLSITSRRAAVEHHDENTLETYPRWLPTTYNLKTELLQFASYYQHRAAKSLDNHWIIKPWNLARGLDTNITDSITQIMRLPATGPKIAQKYIENPVLFQRAELNGKVKFDVRYVVLLKSAQPVEAYIYRKFFLRFANRPFSLNDFDNYEKHFTVMNYQHESDLCHIKCDDFLDYWQQQYPTYPWCQIEDEICEMLHELLVCATSKPPPRGISACQQSRALYAADIMLEWTNNLQKIQPKLLEVNWTPDCKRACDYYPDFFNDIFKLLFLDESNDECFRLLTDRNN